MSLMKIHNDSLFDVLHKFVQIVARAASNIIKFILPVGFATAVFYTFHEYRCKRLANVESAGRLKSEPRFESLRCARESSVINHKYMLSALLQAADRSNEKLYALKCIDIVVRCPQLMNVKCFPHGFTAFHYVCFRGQDSLITFMLAKGADVSVATERGETALCMAVYHFLNEPEKKDFSRLDVLIQAGSEFGVGNKLYDTLLKMAISCKHKKLVEWLILKPSHQISRSVTSQIMRF